MLHIAEKPVEFRLKSPVEQHVDGALSIMSVPLTSSYKAHAPRKSCKAGAAIGDDPHRFTLK